uniref:C-type lectin domain-containing protein n=1 Tax=Panagrellus redivivus TaxID=6233 RepID=A0A7E4W1J1_PANRE
MTFCEVFGVGKTPDCPPGWIRYNRLKTCYYINREALMWEAAEKYCIAQGAHLASINDEYENHFLFDHGRKANLSTPTVWLGTVTKLDSNHYNIPYEWSDGTICGYSTGFKNAPPTGRKSCLTVWLDSERPEGSWNEWDCEYETGFASVCKKEFHREIPVFVASPTPTPDGHHSSKRCSVGAEGACGTDERCIPDDLNCLVKNCGNNVQGWCLPLPTPTP